MKKLPRFGCSKPPPPEIAALPDETTVAAAQTATLENLSSLIALPETTKNFTADGIKQAFDQALAGLSADGWRVIIDTGSKTGISVNQETKAVKVPAERAVFAQELRQLIAHEIGTLN